MSTPWLSWWNVVAILLLALLLLCYCCLDLTQEEQTEERHDSVSLNPDVEDMDVRLEAQVMRDKSPTDESSHSFYN